MITSTFAYRDLFVDDANPRKRGLSDDATVELALAIGRRGLLNPPRVTPAGGILAGQRRYLAIGCLIRWCQEGTIGSVLERVDGDLDDLAVFERRARELEERVPCIIEETDADREVDALSDNLHRADMLSYDVAEALVRRFERPTDPADAMTLTRLAREVGKSLSWVSRMVSTYRLASPELHAAWSADRISFEQARELAALPHDQQRKVLANGGKPKTSHGRPGIERVKELRDRFQADGGHTASDLHRGVLTALRVVAGDEPVSVLEQLLASA